MRVIMILVLFAFTGTFASALTLKEKQYVEATKKDIADPDKGYSKTFKDKCGYDLPVTFDETMVTPFMEANRSLPGYCDAPRSQLSTMCEDATAKTAIKAKIKKVSCHYAKGDKVSFKLVGGDLQYTVGLDANNLEQQTKEFVENNL